MKMLQEGIWQTAQLLEPSVCSKIIVQAEMAGFTRSKAMQSFGRHNDETFLNNRAVSDIIQQGISEQIVDTDLSPGLYLQKFMECYRYQVQDYLAPHKDASREVEADFWSTHTLVIFLNNSFTGGDLTFPEHDLVCRPPVGKGILFEHDKIHASDPIVTGTKYIVRSSACLLKQPD